MKSYTISALKAKDSGRALAFFATSGTAYGPDDEKALVNGMESGDWQCVMAVENGVDIGGFYLNWTPKYDVYRRLELPEMQDLRVLSGHRRKGVATDLIAFAEDAARARGCKGMGLSVGLYADYGAAQRLYIKLGYEPDGQGVTYDRKPVIPGAKLPVDDDLALMLIKFF